MKKNTSTPGEKKMRPIRSSGVETWWHELKAEYFSFHKHNFRDQDGYSIAPDWNPQKIGMEAGALKKIIIFLREIAEGKKIEWTLEYAKKQITDFLSKAICDPWLKKNFYCAMLNKKKVDIVCSTYHPRLSKKILELWYAKYPGYVRDYEKDKSAAEVIIGFLKQQYVLNSLSFTEESILSSTVVIYDEVGRDNFWRLKSLSSISKNIQEFVNRIKSRRDGQSNSVTQSSKLGTNYKTAGQDIFAERLRRKVEGKLNRSGSSDL